MSVTRSMSARARALALSLVILTACGTGNGLQTPVSGHGSSSPTDTGNQAGLDASADASATDAATPAAGTSPVTAGANAGGALGTNAGATSVAGRGAAGNAAGSSVADAGVDAGPPVCTIPNEVAITDDDADGGLAPDCQNVPRKLIANNCIGGFCHNTRVRPAGLLDLMAPCVADRLINVKSRCQEMMLIDTVNPEKSFLLDKLNHLMPACGESMPQGGQLPSDELSCMNAWIHAVIRATRQR